MESPGDLFLGTAEQTRAWASSALIAKSFSDQSFVPGEITKVVKLNTIFYNAFVEDEEGNETVYTVAIDGTILKTVCGV